MPDSFNLETDGMGCVSPSTTRNFTMMGWDSFTVLSLTVFTVLDFTMLPEAVRNLIKGADSSGDPGK